MEGYIALNMSVGVLVGRLVGHVKAILDFVVDGCGGGGGVSIKKNLVSH